jgi:hypothetical protein
VAHQNDFTFQSGQLFVDLGHPGGCIRALFVGHLRKAHGIVVTKRSLQRCREQRVFFVCSVSTTLYEEHVLFHVPAS